jgi:hypothetical protein
MKVVIFFDRSNEINIGVGECTILSDHWYTRGIMYEVPATLTLNELVQLMQENVNIQSDSIDVINELLRSKTFHRRSCYGYRPIQGTDLLVPPDIEQDEVVEFLLL